MLNYNFLLQKYCSRYKCDCIGNTYEGIAWYEDKVKKPSKEQFEKWWNESKEEYSDSLREQVKISSLRESEYPSINELVVALWELVVEEKQEKAVELQRIRRIIKEKYQNYVPPQAEDPEA
jgi:hypothetical protein